MPAPPVLGALLVPPVQLQRIEQDEEFLADLRKRCDRLAPSFTQEAERTAWAALLQELNLD